MINGIGCSIMANNGKGVSIMWFLVGKNSVKKPSDNTGTDKAPAKKTRAKKAV